jgi:23S rRNA (guanosine2251-2'-O)-methyltransferase
MNKHKIVLIVHNIRSTHNVGSIFRTANGLGVDTLFLSGYTPYPETKDDERLPHLRSKISRQINKTALGAETYTNWMHIKNVEELILELKKKNYLIAALEQTDKSINLNGFNHQGDTALIIGNEVDGIDEATLNLADIHLEIPMLGKKESFNVAVASAIALYYLRFNISG